MTADWIKINSISWLFIPAIYLINSSAEAFISEWLIGSYPVGELLREQVD